MTIKSGNITLLAGGSIGGDEFPDGALGASQGMVIHRNHTNHANAALRKIVEKHIRDGRADEALTALRSERNYVLSQDLIQIERNLHQAIMILNDYAPDALAQGQNTSTLALECLMDRLAAKRTVSPPGKVMGSVALITGHLGAGGAELQMTTTAEMLASAVAAKQKIDGVKLTGPIHVVVKSLAPQGKRSLDTFLRHLARKEIPVWRVDDLPAKEPEEVVADDVDLTALLSIVNLEIRRGLRLAPWFQGQSIQVAYIWQDSSILRSVVAALIAGTPRIVLNLRGMPPVLRWNEHLADYKVLYAALARTPGVTFVTNSSSAADAYAEWTGCPRERFHLLRNGVRIHGLHPRALERKAWAEFQARTSDATITVGAIFRMHPNKRPFEWVQFARRYLDSHPKARFILIGSGIFLESIKDLIRSSGLSDSLLLITQTHAVAFWLKKMDVFVLLSRYEGTPNVLIEAQLAGVPVVCTPAADAQQTFLEGVTGLATASAETLDVDEVVTKVDLAFAFSRASGEVSHLARRHIANRFSTSAMIQHTVRILSGRDHACCFRPETPKHGRHEHEAGLPSPNSETTLHSPKLDDKRNAHSIDSAACPPVNLQDPQGTIVPMITEPAADMKKVAELVRDLRVSWKDRDYVRTIELARELAKSEPENVLGPIYLCRAASAIEQWPDAASAALAIVQSSPVDAFAVARKLSGAGSVREAAQIFNALEFDQDWFTPDMVDHAWRHGITMLKRGDQAMASGDPELAKIAWVAGARLAPSSRILSSRVREIAKTAKLAANDIERDKDPVAYIEAWREVLRMEPTNLSAAVKVAQALSRNTDNHTATLDAWIKVLEINPTHQDAVDKVRRVAARNHLEDRAIKGLKRLGRDEATDPLVSELISELNERAGRAHEQALKSQLRAALVNARAVDPGMEPRRFLLAWKEVLVLNPKYLAAARKVVSIARQLDDGAELVDGLIALVQIDPSDIANVSRLISAGLNRRQEQKTLDCLAAYGHADLSNPKIEKLFTRLHRICRDALRASEFTLALSCFQTLARINAEHPLVELLKPNLVRRAATSAKVAERAGHISEAMHLAEAVLLIAPDEPIALAVVARDMIRDKRYQDVVSLCAPKIGPDPSWDSVRTLVEKATAKVAA